MFDVVFKGGGGGGGWVCLFFGFFLVILEKNFWNIYSTVKNN